LSFVLWIQGWDPWSGKRLNNTQQSPISDLKHIIHFLHVEDEYSLSSSCGMALSRYSCASAFVLFVRCLLWEFGRIIHRDLMGTNNLFLFLDSKNAVILDEDIFTISCNVNSDRPFTVFSMGGFVPPAIPPWQILRPMCVPLRVIAMKMHRRQYFRRR
jgi:hypothetical protein